MKHKISKKKCQENITKGNVCSQCGGELSPIDTVDNSNDPTFWPGCEKCCRFDNGVPEKIYNTAKELVVNERYGHYSHIEIKETDSKETIEYKTQCQISGACSIVSGVLRIYNKSKQLLPGG